MSARIADKFKFLVFQIRAFIVCSIQNKGFNLTKIRQIDFPIHFHWMSPFSIFRCVVLFSFRLIDRKTHIKQRVKIQIRRHIMWCLISNGCGSSFSSMSASQAMVPQWILVSGTIFEGKNNFPLPLIQEEPVVCLLHVFHRIKFYLSLTSSF